MRQVWMTGMMAGLLAALLTGCTSEDAGPWSDDEDVGEAEQGLNQPDLIVESFTLVDGVGGVDATVVIKNQGDAASPYMSGAFRNTRVYAPGTFGPGCYGATFSNYTGPIAAGATRTFNFNIGGWTIAGIESCSATWITETDTSNNASESDETNNVKLGKD